MNRALLYLWLSLLKRRAWQFVRDLRRPTTLIGVAAVLSLLGVIFHYRHEEAFGQLLEPKSLGVLAFLLLAGSLLKGFWQRGLVFEPPDIEFLFTSPFTQRQIVFYRLLPNYLYSALQGLVVAALFAPHLKHPLLMAVCLAFFQATCFHVATGAAVFAGTLPEALHHRLRCMTAAALALLTVVYFRAAWDIRFIPALALSPVSQLFFYPAANLPDLATAPLLHRLLLRLGPSGSLWAQELWRPVLSLGGLALAAGASLWALLKVKAHLFEASLAPSSRVAERRLRLRQGRDTVAARKRQARSSRLPRLGLFRGMGAIVWKNLVVARRSRRQMTAAFVFTCIFTGCLGALIYQVYAQAGLEFDARAALAARSFNLGIALFLAMLAFFLQRMFPFDFRRDGQHLLGFRTLPLPPTALVLAEVTVPVAFVLACQFVGLLPLLVFGRVESSLLLLLLLVYPAVALALTIVWNLHYLLSATRRAGGRDQSSSAVGTLMVVALSFLIFLPAIWTVSHLSGKTSPLSGGGDALPETAGFWGRSLQGGFAFAAGGGVLVQYLVNGLLLLLLARLFQRFEVARDA